MNVGGNTGLVVLFLVVIGLLMIAANGFVVPFIVWIVIGLWSLIEVGALVYAWMIFKDIILPKKG